MGWKGGSSEMTRRSEQSYWCQKKYSCAGGVSSEHSFSLSGSQCTAPAQCEQDKENTDERRSTSHYCFAVQVSSVSRCHTVLTGF